MYLERAHPAFLTTLVVLVKNVTARLISLKACFFCLSPTLVDISLNLIFFRWTSSLSGQLQSVLGIWIPGDRNGFRVTDKAIYKDKLYLALENCKVLVYNINTLLQLTTLENPSSNDDEGEVVEDQLGQDGGHALSLSCKIAQHGRWGRASCQYNRVHKKCNN